MEVELTMPKKVTFNIVDSNLQQLESIQAFLSERGYFVTTTDILNIALREFFNAAADSGNELSSEGDIVAVLEKYVIT